MWKACENLLLYIFKEDISRESVIQLLLFCCCKGKHELQCSGLTSKHSNSFVIVFIVWRQFFCFVFARQILTFSPFSLSFLNRKKCTFHGNIYTNGKVKPFSNKIYNYLVKKKKKKVIFWLIARSHISPIFLLFWVQICINCTCLREN